jgi:hypothetical protein
MMQYINGSTAAKNRKVPASVFAAAEQQHRQHQDNT